MQNEKSTIEKKEIVVGTRGKIFKGIVTKKFPMRVVVEFERTVYMHKYERYYKKKTRLHARLPENVKVEVGDLINVRECRPLSKIIHFIVLGKVSGEEKK
ncbi:MAG: 30S ribosomal protein S17 [Nanoarchaeota archaeon]